jgi:hypothetical protein
VARRFLSTEEFLELSLQCGNSLFCIAYPALHLPCRLFDLSLGFQAAVVGNLSCLLLDCSLHFVEAALDLVFGAGVHISPQFSQSPFGQRTFEFCHSYNLAASGYLSTLDHR